MKKRCKHYIVGKGCGHKDYERRIELKLCAGKTDNCYIREEKDAPAFDYEGFKEWYGDRPKRSLFDISKELETAKRNVAFLNKELFDWEIYHAREDAALKSFVNTVYRMKIKGE